MFKMLVDVCPNNIFWTTEHFVTKPVMVMQHHKPECSVEKWDYCIQGQGHSKASKCQWMFFLMIFSLCVRLCPHNISWTAEPFFLPNMVWWYITTKQCVLWKNWFTIFNVKVTAWAYIIEIWPFLLYLLNCWSVCNQTSFYSTAL